MSLVQSAIRASRLIPVVAIDQEKQGIMVADALLRAGIHCMEVTLRTERALDIIAGINRYSPDMTVGAGTILNLGQLQESRLAGAKFFVSPGLSPELMTYAKEASLPYLPGVSTCSEIMQAIALGYSELKLFPADVIGGVSFLKAMKGPFPHVKFCPTGGIDEDNLSDYLGLDSVFAIGGSWMVPRDMVSRLDDSGIESLARQALTRVSYR
jgi:2-dehydro-3-deoxyphosphogluconate aldolase/(4S)-4-hydroxy-2-oxoglutarate aldolase